MFCQYAQELSVMLILKIEILALLPFYPVSRCTNLDVNKHSRQSPLTMICLVSTGILHQCLLPGTLELRSSRGSHSYHSLYANGAPCCCAVCSLCSPTLGSCTSADILPSKNVNEADAVLHMVSAREGQGK